MHLIGVALQDMGALTQAAIALYYANEKDKGDCEKLQPKLISKTLIISAYESFPQSILSLSSKNKKWQPDVLNVFSCLFF